MEYHRNARDSFFSLSFSEDLYDTLPGLFAHEAPRSDLCHGQCNSPYAAMSQILPPTSVDNLDPRDYIIVKGTRTNNLQNLDVAIPRNQFTVITGLSGSGKSSLAFDTIFAEGQRMYVESLSTYMRQFLGKMEKPPVTYIRGVAPTIAITQATKINNPRSTVGTMTEVYDYLKLLYTKIGTTFSPISGERVSKDSVQDVVDYLRGLSEGSKILVLSPLQKRSDRPLQEILRTELSKGFTHVAQGKQILFIEDLIANTTSFPPPSDLYLVIDRLMVNQEDENQSSRLADSIQTSFFDA